MSHNDEVSGGSSFLFVRARPLLTATLVATLVTAGCAQSSQIDASGSDTEEIATETGAIPGWIQRAFDAARASDSESEVLPPTRRSSSSNENAALPDRDAVVPALIAAGLSAEQAECVYTGLSSNPAVAQDLELISSTLASSSDGGVNVSALASLDPDASTRILASLAPCLDAGSLSLLLGGLGSGGSLAALLPGLAGGNIDLAALQGLDLSGLDPSLAAALNAYVASLAGGGAPDLSGFDLSGIDIGNLDLSSISPDQLPTLILAILAGLSAGQRQQLSDLAQIDFDNLGIDIDADNLTPEQIGGLLLLISPLAVAAISPNGGAPPPGADPSQIYIPPGTDLSQINPLNFVPRETVIQGAIDQGISPGAAGCLFDNLKAINPTSLGSLFSNSPNPVAVAELALAAVLCVLSP